MDTLTPKTSIRTFKQHYLDEVRHLFSIGADVLPPDVRQATMDYYEDALATDMADIEGSYLASDDSHFWVAEEDGRLVGTVGIVRHSATDAQLKHLVVGPVSRGRGIGRRLLQTAEEFAFGHGYSGITLFTLSAQTAAISLYTLADYVRAGRFRFRPADVLILRKTMPG